MPPSSKKKKDATSTLANPVSRQVNFRADDELHARLTETAKTLGLDVSNLVRMIINENLSTYERRAEQVRAGRKAE